MSLTKYNEKRSFDKTPEPKGGKAAKDELIFVIQKHDASRLHYDFRLEMDGVLKSWAVPKGPSTDPTVKRLAMMVEDHPYDYKDFEGIIPEGNYGAGTVMVWDFGTYEPLEEVGGKLKGVEGKKAKEKLLRKELHSGSLKVRLNGKKLKGEYALVKTKGMEDNAWLLIKHRDKYASEDDITENDRSAVSRRTLQGIEKNGDAVWESNREEKKSSKTKTQKTGAKDPAEEVATEKKTPEIDLAVILKKGKKQKFPGDLQPMLATLVDGPFDDPGWEYEVKWDGYRALASLNKGDVSLQSRNKKSFNDKFYPIYRQLQEWKTNAVIDGEIVVINEKGLSDFNALQNWRSEADGELVYYAFDILWLEGKSLMHLPLTERKAILQSIVDESSPVQLGYSVAADGKAFFDAAKKIGLEGIIAKKSDSGYYPGIRTRDWLKIKINKRQEVIIAGYTLNQGSPKLFSALLLAAYDEGKLHYIGKVGTGFKEKQQKEMMALFKPLITQKSPFKETPDYNKPSRFRPNPPHANVTWLKPELVCEISFTEITSDGVFRHPSFEGMREDKSAKEVIREIEKPAGKVVDEVNLPMLHARRHLQ